MKKKGELAFNCPSLTSWKELLCCSAHRSKPEKQHWAAMCWCSVEGHWSDADSAFFVSDLKDRLKMRRNLFTRKTQQVSVWGNAEQAQTAQGYHYSSLCFSSRQATLCWKYFRRASFLGSVMRIKCPISEQREVAVQFLRIKTTLGAFGGALWWNQLCFSTCCVCGVKGGRACYERVDVLWSLYSLNVLLDL